jgi:hypothetical protein
VFGFGGTKGPEWEKRGLLSYGFPVLGWIWLPVVLPLRRRKRQRFLKHVPLTSGNWVDLTEATPLARWKALAGPLGTQEFTLYRTSRGTLVWKEPVERRKLRFGLIPVPSLWQVVRYEYQEMPSEADAVAAMVQYNGAKQAERLFPTEFSEYQIRTRGEQR